MHQFKIKGIDHPAVAAENVEALASLVLRGPGL